MHLFNSFSLIRTTLYVVHGQYISLYNIQESQWLKHAKFEEAEIAKLVKKKILRKGNDHYSSKAEAEKLELAVILTNGSVYINLQSVIFADEKKKQETSTQGIIIT